MSNLELPSCVSAERAVLGAAIMDYVDLSSTGLIVSDFFLEDNRRIFKSLTSMRTAGEGISYGTLYQRIERDHHRAIPVSELVALADGVFPTLPMDGFVRAVRNAGLKRRLIESCRHTANLAMHGEDTPTLLDGYARSLQALQSDAQPELDFHTPREIIERSGGLDAYFDRRSLPGIESPWPQFNRLTRGLHPKELVIVAAGTSRGKTAWALNYGYHAAVKGHGVALYSMEMHENEILDRWLCIAGRIDTYKIRRPENGDRRQVLEAANLAAQHPIHICDRGTCTLATIEASLRRLRAKTKIDLVIVDYLNLMTPVGRQENRVQEVSKLSRGLKLLAADFDIPIIAVCQLNRSPSNEKRPPELNDLRESGSIEQDANLVVFLHSTQAYQTGQATKWVDCDVIIAKQRNGIARVKIPSLFRQDWGVFEERAEEEENA